MSEWRSIESAPKDGASVILYDGECVGEGSYKGDDADAGWWWANTDPGDYYADKLSPDPTHWMPLPEPPTSKVRAE